MTKTAFPFAPDELVIANDGAVAAVDGEEYIVHVGQRLRSSHPMVRAHPWLFTRDGEPLVPMARPEIPDEPPPPPPKPVRMLRSKRDVDERFEVKGHFGGPPETIHLTLHEGKLTREDEPWLEVLTDKQRRSYFEVVEP